MTAKTQPTPKFWLEAARLVLSKRTALYVNIQTGLPVIDQEAAHAFACSLNEDEIEWLALPSVQEQLRQWQDCPLDRLDCTILDMQTANVLVTVYEALSPEKREKFRQCSLKRAVDLAWKCVK